MEKIIIDTNFVLAISQFKIDIFAEIKRICNFNYSLYIIDKSIEELDNIIKKQGGKARAAAKLAKSMIEGRIEILNTKEGYADDIIADLSDNYIVATQDKELKRRLKGRVITIKQKKFLIIS